MIQEATVISMATGDPVTQIKENALTNCYDCAHKVFVDPLLRQITCRDCGRVIDAFGWALQMSREESALINRIQYLKSEADSREASVALLKEQEKLIKGRIRTAKEALFKAVVNEKTNSFAP